MDAMTKMWVSFIAIGLMVVSSFLITYARSRKKTAVRILLSVAAVILFIYAIIFGIFSIV